MKRKIVIMTTMFGRHDLTDYVFSFYKKLKDKFEHEHEILTLELVVAGSEGAVSRFIAERNDFHYVETPNIPLSFKTNEALKFCKTLNPDAVVLIGSDDLMTENLFNEYAKCFVDELDYFGFEDFYMYSSLKQLYHWPGYRGLRSGETIGAGRFFSKKLLDLVDWDLWGAEEKNKGLDMLCEAKLSNLNLKRHSIKLPKKGMILDIKSGINLTRVALYDDRELIESNNLSILDISIDELHEVMNRDFRSENSIFQQYVKHRKNEG
jgi:hypothetical protein